VTYQEAGQAVKQYFISLKKKAPDNFKKGVNGVTSGDIGEGKAL